MAEILKKLRKLWRRQKGLIALGSILLILVLSRIFISAPFEEIEQTKGADTNTRIPHQEEAQDLSIEVMGSAPYTITLQKKYVCGIETETLPFDHELELEEWLQQHAYEWEIINREEGNYTLLKEITNELSTLCKEEGYFGLTEDGTLTIFEGPPTENKVIQTFFRIDTQRLESQLPRTEYLTLINGIRIHNMEEYRSVLSTYGEFAAEY